MTAPDGLGVGELLAGYRAGDVTPVDAVDACLDRMAERADLGCVVTSVADRARAEARASAARWARGEAGPLDGVPFGVKDNIATAGVRTTVGGWPPRAGWVPDADATAVARLRGAGAVLVAKLATPELAFGDARPGHRPTNPWSPDHWTGGSSSGCAVALAGGLLPLALGTDTGGSIRVPASYCGVTGLKPTLGRVPRDGVAMVSWTLDHTGPMARSADDVRRALSVVTGGAIGDGNPPSLRPGLRLGVPQRWFQDTATTEVLGAFEAALAALVDLGAEAVAVDVPEPAAGGVAAWTISVAEFAALRAEDGVPVADYTPTAAERLRAGSALTLGDYLHATRLRADLQARVATLFEDVDVVVTPATPTPAPRVAPEPDPLFAEGDAMWLESVARNLILWNLLGLPALVMPAGFTVDGRPLAVQIVAHPGPAVAGADQQILDVAVAYQAVTAHHRRWPGGPAPASSPVRQRATTA